MRATPWRKRRVRGGKAFARERPVALMEGRGRKIFESVANRPPRNQLPRNRLPESVVSKIIDWLRGIWLF